MGLFIKKSIIFAALSLCSLLKGNSGSGGVAGDGAVAGSAGDREHGVGRDERGVFASAGGGTDGGAAGVGAAVVGVSARGVAVDVR